MRIRKMSRIFQETVEGLPVYCFDVVFDDGQMGAIRTLCETRLFAENLQQRLNEENIEHFGQPVEFYDVSAND